MPGSARQLRRVARSVGEVEAERPAGAIAVVGDEADVEAACRALLARGGRPQLLTDSLEGAGAVVYAGGSLDALAAAARAARPRPFAALVPPSLVEAALRIPGAPARALATSARELPAVLARRLPPSDARLVAGLPALRDPFCRLLIDRASRRAGLLAVLGGQFPGLGVMVAAESRLLLRLGVAHGTPPEQSRIPGVIGAVAASAAMGDAAERSGAGRIRRSGIAALGTLAVGHAALAALRSGRLDRGRSAG
jgi:hypothetical protein